MSNYKAQAEKQAAKKQAINLRKLKQGKRNNWQSIDSEGK